MKNSACMMCEVNNETESDLASLSKNSSFSTKSVVDMGVSFTEWVILAAIVAVRAVEGVLLVEVSALVGAGAVVNTSVEVLSVVVFNEATVDTLSCFKMSLSG